jgi:hypothetical protein
MQIQTQEATAVQGQPAQPAQPAAAPSPRAVIVGPGGADVIELAPLHLTSRDIAALRARRSEISDQLESVDGRRSKLLTQLRSNGDEVAKKGLEDRLALLDKRQLQLETDLAETGRQLSSFPAGQVATAGNSDRNTFGSVNRAMPVLSVVFTIFVLGPLAIGVAKSMWRRASRTAPPTAMITETAQRLERLEHSVDAIALEIERVSEGQRFVTQLLSESQPALPAPAQRAATPARSGQ